MLIVVRARWVLAWRSMISEMRSTVPSKSSLAMLSCGRSHRLPSGRGRTSVDISIKRRRRWGVGGHELERRRSSEIGGIKSGAQSRGFGPGADRDSLFIGSSSSASDTLVPERCDVGEAMGFRSRDPGGSVGRGMLSVVTQPDPGIFFES